MGVLNVTPDSFSDGGRYSSPAAALEHARRLAADGADIIDIGGESTRPGAEAVPAAQELARVQPVLDGLAAQGLAAQVSIDTSKAIVARAALAAGASLDLDPGAERVTGIGQEQAAFTAGEHPREELGEPRRHVAEGGGEQLGHLQVDVLDQALEVPPGRPDVLQLPDQEVVPGLQ